MKTRPATDFTVIVDNQRSWCEWFPTREQALSYARLVAPMVADRVIVLDCHDSAVAEFRARDSKAALGESPALSADPEDIVVQAPVLVP